MRQFATTLFPTPVFNCRSLDSYLGKEGENPILLDKQDLLRCIETVLFSGTRVELFEKIPQPKFSTSFYQIHTEEYPYKGAFFVDERFLIKTKEVPQKRTFHLPCVQTMVRMAELLKGTRYIWGGNWPLGIPLLLDFFPPKQSLNSLSSLQKETWQLKGVDCSGLLYFLSDGYTPRNTSSLLHFGQSLAIKNKSIEEIQASVQPLDLIVYPGHVIIILDQKRTIESKVLKGVIETPLKTLLHELFKTKTAVDHSKDCQANQFVINRWYPFKNA